MVDILKRKDLFRCNWYIKIYRLKYMGVLSTSWSSLLPDPLWLSVLTPVWVLSIGQIELFNHLVRIKFDLVSLFNDTSTFVDYLMPKPSL